MSDENYIFWTDKKTERPIQQPKPILDHVHKRVGTLLARIETPEFLHSAIKGRSYITNAMQHAPDHPTVKIDIKKFYPSTRAQAVFHFFRDRMLCDGDVAGMLAKLLTVNGHLATGSSVSPILSYFAYEDMFAEIEALAVARNCQMTCYVDDMIFTGPRATRRLIYEAIQIIRRYRMRGHKTKIFNAGQPKVITGVAVTRTGSRLPNKRQKNISDELVKIEKALNSDDCLDMMESLVGRMYEAAQIDNSWLPRAKAASIQKNRLKRLSLSLNK